MKLIRCLLTTAALLAFMFCATATAQAPPKKSTAASSKSSRKAALLDLNTATEDELKTLPGIGEAYSKAIVKNRPYRSKNELVQKKVIPQATYEKIRDRVVAHRTDSSGAAATK